MNFIELRSTTVLLPGKYYTLDAHLSADALCRPGNGEGRRKKRTFEIRSSSLSFRQHLYDQKEGGEEVSFVYSFHRYPSLQ